MRVEQILCAAGRFDAVTGQALACRRLFRDWGWSGEDYAPVIAPGLPRGAVRHLSELSPGRADVVLIHYSGYARGMEQVLEQARPNLLLSHNVTPAAYLWDHEPLDALACELAVEQLPDLIQRADLIAGVSEYNVSKLHELGASDATVLPILFDRSSLGTPSAPHQNADGNQVLFVGRLAPHKRQDLVIAAFARYWQQAPSSRLTLVGTPMSATFRESLRSLADRLAPGAVRFEQTLPEAELAARYRAADVFLCLSEHEGFCIPLLEAFHFRLPVIARRAGAVPEVVGDAGVLLEEEDGSATIAELLKIVLADGELRTELAERGEKRLERYDHRTVATRLRETLEGLAA